jgi:hypothetical protein
MAIGKLVRTGVPGLVIRWASGLRFPVMFILTALLFVINLFIPDVIPLVDEVLMGLVALMFANLRKQPEKETSQSPSQE